uniref:Putative ATPbinding transport protein n=1 Tax=termite gut metagenome TaxID=433724 RepID=S0DFU6_9ZZZZ
MERLRRNKRTICLFVLPALLGYLLVFAFPILSSVVMSFFKWDVGGMQKFLGITNYSKLFTTDNIFQQSIWHVLYSALLCLVAQAPLSILLAYLLTRIKRLRNFFKVVFFVPNMVSSAAIGILWIFIYNPQFGLLNSALGGIGLGGLARAWLGDPATALTAVILATCWQFIGYHMIIYLAAMQNISESINEAAEIDGASAWQSFWRITMPLLAPILKIDFVLIVTGSLRIFDVVYVMTTGGPNHASEMIATHMYTRTFKGMEFGYGSAMSVLLIIMCLLITGVLNLAFRRVESLEE